MGRQVRPVQLLDSYYDSSLGANALNNHSLLLRSRKAGIAPRGFSRQSQDN